MSWEQSKNMKTKNEKTQNQNSEEDAIAKTETLTFQLRNLCFRKITNHHLRATAMALGRNLRHLIECAAVRCEPFV